jgi:hypothetical protein
MEIGTDRDTASRTVESVLSASSIGGEIGNWSYGGP